MARIRTIKPEFWTDSKIVQLSPLARLLFIGIWNFADDYGTVEADPLQLKLKVLPAEPCNAEDLIDELMKVGLLVAMSNGPDTFWQVAGWERHQKVDRRSKSQFGEPDSWHPAEPSTSPAESPRIPPSPRAGREGKGREKTMSVPDGTDAEFDRFWDAYPRHHDTNAKGGGGVKAQALKRWQKLTPTQRDEVTAALTTYAKVCRPDGQKPKHAERFLQHDAWKPYLPAANEKPKRADLCPLCDRDLTRPDHDELCEVFR
jgi:hypothetical protein